MNLKAVPTRLRETASRSGYVCESNNNTRRAYARAAARFSDWCAEHGLTPAELEPHEAAAYVEGLKVEGLAVTTVKQQLSALRNLCDYLVTGGTMRWNPFAPVRGPRHSQRARVIRMASAPSAFSKIVWP